MLQMKNGFIMPPLKLGYCTETGFINDKHLHFYNKISKHLGAVTLEPLYMDASLREIPTQLGIDNDAKIEGLLKLTNALHKVNTKAIAHLNHPGRMANPKIPGNVFISSTNNPCPTVDKQPLKMTGEDIVSVINLFVSSAKRAEKAGFDVVEIQAGHGYLLAQFISPKVNNRTDEYGGSFENRIQFPIQVIKAVKEAVSIPIIVRISADEMIPDGIKLDEMIQFSTILKEEGIAAIHVSSGSVCDTPPWYFQHMFVPKGKTWEFASKINAEASIPVIFVGQINAYEDIDLIKNKYGGTYMAVGRALVADPNFIGNYLSGAKDSYRPCLACSEGCLGGVKSGKGLGCMVNPEINNDNKSGIESNTKKIAIIGGGLAGMESAIRLHGKGHKVTLFEKEKLGGQFNLAWLPPKKTTLKRILTYYAAEIKKQNIPVVYKEVIKEDLIPDFDDVIIATGAKAFIPKIKGLQQYHWAEILQEKLPTNKKIVIIGGGLIGVEIASSLVEHSNEVILVEMLDEIARGMEMIERKMTLKKLQNHKVQILTNTKVVEIKDKGKTVLIEGAKELSLTNIDLVILSTGMQSNTDLIAKLDNQIPYHIIGDAQKPAKAQEAISSAYNLASRL